MEESKEPKRKNKKRGCRKEMEPNAAIEREGGEMLPPSVVVTNLQKRKFSSKIGSVKRIPEMTETNRKESGNNLLHFPFQQDQVT